MDSKSGSIPTSAPAYRWMHVPDLGTVYWIWFTLAPITWDTVYMLCRPYTMEGGWMNWPIWVPYIKYGEVDHVYGWKAYNAGTGFSGAQSFMNIVETVMYLYYLYVYYAKGTSSNVKGGKKAISGYEGALAVLVCFASAVMTFSKTILYWACEWFGNYENIGQNTPFDLVVFWIIPNGLWFIGSGYMIWQLGRDIAESLLNPLGQSVQGKGH